MRSVEVCVEIRCWGRHHNEVLRDMTSCWYNIMMIRRRQDECWHTYMDTHKFITCTCYKYLDTLWLCTHPQSLFTLQLRCRYRNPQCQVQGMYGWLECQAWGHMPGTSHVWMAGMPGMRTCIRKTTFEFLCLFTSYHVFSHLIADIRPDKTESTYCMSYHIKT